MLCSWVSSSFAKKNILPFSCYPLSLFLKIRHLLALRSREDKIYFHCSVRKKTDCFCPLEGTQAVKMGLGHLAFTQGRLVFTWKITKKNLEQEKESKSHCNVNLRSNDWSMSAREQHAISSKNATFKQYELGHNTLHCWFVFWYSRMIFIS